MYLQPRNHKIKIYGSFYSLNILIVWENELVNLPIIFNEPNRCKGESIDDSL